MLSGEPAGISEASQKSSFQRSFWKELVVTQFCIPPSLLGWFGAHLVYPVPAPCSHPKEPEFDLLLKPIHLVLPMPPRLLTSWFSWALLTVTSQPLLRESHVNAAMNQLVRNVPLTGA